MTAQTCLECKPVAGTVSQRERRQVFRPVTDIHQSEAGVELVMDLPGVNQKNVNLTVEQDTLTVTGQRNIDVEGTEVYCETHRGEYRRAFRLGEDVDTDNITADMQDGVLTVHLPKLAKAQPRRIEIAGV